MTVTAALVAAVVPLDAVDPAWPVDPLGAVVPPIGVVPSGAVDTFMPVVSPRAVDPAREVESPIAVVPPDAVEPTAAVDATVLPPTVVEPSDGPILVTVTAAVEAPAVAGADVAAGVPPSHVNWAIAVEES